MQNTLFTNDNLFILYGMNSECLDLIYLDPPFNSKRTYSAPVGSKAAGSSFKDMWTWQDVNDGYLDKLIEKYPSLVRFVQSIEKIHSKGMMSYVVYMTQRLIEMHRILKETGSIYLHCDPTASHYLKIVMDEIFGRVNFRNEIIWYRNFSSGKGSQYEAKKFGANTDTILFYTKSNNFYININREFATDSDEILKTFPKIDENNRRYNTATPIFRSKSMGARPNLCYQWKGFKNPYPSGWRLSKERLEEEYEKGNIVITKDGKLERRKYLDDYLGKPMDNNWFDIPRATGKEATGYPTQKPIALLERIITASSKECDIVFDPFCGCATTCVAAQKLGRKWIGIDIEKKAAEVLIERLEKDGHMNDGFTFLKKGENFIHRLDVPQRTDIKTESADDKSVKERLFKQQDGNCNACGVEMRIVDFEVDHVIPKSKGGGDYYENYQLICGNCNRIKGNRPMEYLRIKIKQREEMMKDSITFGE
jgi:DNA modification methylase